MANPPQIQTDKGGFQLQHHVANFTFAVTTSQAYISTNHTAGCIKLLPTTRYRSAWDCIATSIISRLR
jgi:hypothetical protein